MKKSIIFTLLIGLVIAGYGATVVAPNDGVIGPGIATSTLNVSAPSAGKRLCLTNLTVCQNVTTSSPTNFVVNVQFGGSLTWFVVMSTGTTLVQNWSTTNPMCGPPNTALSVAVSGPSTYDINYMGYVSTQ